MFSKEYHACTTVTVITARVVTGTPTHVGFPGTGFLTNMLPVSTLNAASRLNTAPGTVTDKGVMIFFPYSVTMFAALYAADSFLRILTGALFVTAAVTPYVPTVLRTSAGWTTMTSRSSSARTLKSLDLKSRLFNSFSCPKYPVGANFVKIY